MLAPFCRLLALAGLLCLTISCVHAFAADPPYVSRTFAEILSRVAERDSDSGAILTVKPKDDAPRLAYNLTFSMTSEPNSDEVVIDLTIAQKTGDVVFERYRLRIDDAIRKELALLRKQPEVEKRREAAAVAEWTAKIEKVTKGKLRYGMTRDEVEKILGKPTEVISAQAFGSLSLVYPAYRLGFWMGRLQSVETE